MKTWGKIIASLESLLVSENETRPAQPKERAREFHSFVFDTSATELEYLNLLNAHVFATKPRCCLETGTASGMGTLAIASALKDNGAGRLVTVDLNFCNTAKAIVKKFGLTEQVTFVRSNALEWIRKYEEECFDFAFIDSGATGRVTELDELITLRKIKGDVFIHDLSSPRLDGYEFPEKEIERLKGILGKNVRGFREFYLSRGLLYMEVVE